MIALGWMYNVADGAFVSFLVYFEFEELFTEAFNIETIEEFALSEVFSFEAW